MNHNLMQAKLLLVALCYSFFLVVGFTPGMALAGGEKVTLCHVPPGNPADAHEIVVAPSAAKAHLKNHAGDHLGPCAQPPECQTNAQCNDANPCTVDTCTAGGTCDYSQPVVCNDGNPCTDDVCLVEQGGCVGVPAPGTECNDGDVCTGTDICNAAGACAGTAIAGCCSSDAACGDNDACTTDVCNLASYTCSNTEITPPEAAPCYLFICDSELGGINVDVPVTCADDGNICTVEVCDPSIGTRGACVTNPNPNPPPESIAANNCADGLDNDCDGLIDSADSDCAPPPAGCPCVDSGDLIWNDAAAMKAYWISFRSLYSDWSCMKDTATLQATFMGIQNYCYGSSPVAAPPTVMSGYCMKSDNDLIPVDSAQAQACIQRMEALGAQLDPPVTCVDSGGGGGANY